ncbi:anthocyanidin reductase ((2S)-flavan-3-ol-forming)-like [Solanum dulcamara]|uniref:anthocyanidin reductase ((2S)-flavan-3-ol-forming)-like n=1 Tax=Solanum dulcamara TaxID=45834 RepID=UPI0024858535|nr:anthocyanidin reductase ((2S)-flavan-3-ol-forming)-like [Solanum dulcamara]
MEDKNRISMVVCVTGGSGYIASFLVKKLLENGYKVHATLRNLEDKSKVGLLKSLPNAEGNLKLFQADMYRPEEYEQAIKGCEFVFHMATPFLHTEGFQYKNPVEAAVASVKNIGMACIKSGTVKRLIYTSTVLAASPLKDDGNGFKDLIDETCWTPLNVHFPFSDDFVLDYVVAKTTCEKEILNFGKDGFEVVSLGCGLVGGTTLLSNISVSMADILSVVTGDEIYYKHLKFIEEVDGKVPIVHIEDVCEAHIFSMENSDSMNGRFMCASSFVSSAEIASYYQQKYPEFHVNQKYLDDPKREVKWGSNKLMEKGFVYKYEMKKILDDNIRSARELGVLNLPPSA